MKIQVQHMGPYQTNCYIATVEGKDFIIDPGMGATQWVLDHVTNDFACNFNFAFAVNLAPHTAGAIKNHYNIIIAALSRGVGKIQNET